MALTAAEIQILLSARDNSSATLNRALVPLKQFPATATAATRGAQGFSRSLTPIPGLLGAASAGARTFAASITGIITAAAPLLAAFAGVFAVVKLFDVAKTAIITFNATLEQSAMAWETLLGSAENAKAFLFDLKAFAAATPFDMEGVERGTRRLVAYGVAAKDALPFLEDIGNVAAAMGGGALGIERLTLALGQMTAKGKVSGEEIRQLTEAGVNVGQIFAVISEQTGKTVGDLRKMQEQGTLTSDVFIKAFRTWSQARFGDAMQKQQKTFSGAMSAIKDSLLIVSSTAFKPLFDRISELAQRLSQFVQTEEFQRWGARVAATVDVILTSLGTLARGFWSALSGVLSIVVDVGRAIYTALSYLNPFARHSPSLVESVDSGVDAIIAKYRTLGLIAQPVNDARLAIAGLAEEAQKGAVDRLKSGVDALRDRAQILGDALSVAKQRLGDFLNTPLQGQRAFTDRLDNITDKLAQNRLKLLRMDMRLDPRVGRGALRREGRQLEKEAELVRLEEMVALGPQKRAITQAADTRLERPFEDILAGVREATRDIATLEPVVRDANAAWKEQADILQDVTAAIKAAKGAGDGADLLGSIDIGDMSFLDDAKARVAAFEADFKKHRDQVIQDAAPYVAAIDSIAGALKRFGDGLKTFGVIGGLSELLFPVSRVPQTQQDVADLPLGNFNPPPRFSNLPDIAAEITEWMKAQFAAVDWPAVWRGVKGHGVAMVGNLAPIVDDVAAWYVANFIPGLLKGAEGADYTEFGKKLLEQIRLQMPIVRELDLLTNLFTGEWRTQLSTKLTGWAGSDWVTLVGRLNAIMIAPFKGIATTLISELIAQFKSDVIAKLPEWMAIGKSIAEGILEGFRNLVRSTPLAGLFPRQPDFTITPEGIRSTAPATNTGGFRPTAPTFDINDPDVRGYQHGGAFRVGGIGGRDSQMVRFRASPDETVQIMTPGQRQAAYGGGKWGGGIQITGPLVSYGSVTVTSQAQAERLASETARQVIVLLDQSEQTSGTRTAPTQPGAI